MRPWGNRKGLVIGSLNINSLLLHIDEVRCFIKVKGFHIVALNETKVDDTIADKLLEIEGYTLCREDRNRYGDRVAVHVAESLKHHRRNDPPERGLEIICLEIEPTGARPFYVVAWYRPPSDPVQTFTKLERNLEFLDWENNEIILAGDTDSDISLLDNSPDNNSNAYNNASHMAAIFDTLGLKQLIEEPTRLTLNSATLIDHIAVSNPENISESGTIKAARSDHYAVYCIRKFMGSFKRQRKTISSRKMKNFSSDRFLYDLQGVSKNCSTFDKILKNKDNVNKLME